jgi:hypothetical protein
MKYKINENEVLGKLFRKYELRYLRGESLYHPNMDAGIDFFVISYYDEDDEYLGEYILRLDSLESEVVGLKIYDSDGEIFTQGYAWDEKWKLRKIGEE